MFGAEPQWVFANLLEHLNHVRKPFQKENWASDPRSLLKMRV